MIHDIIAYDMMPTKCFEPKSENFQKSQCDIIDAVIITKITVFEYRQTSNISCTLGNKLVDNSHVVIASQHCFNYIFILDLIPSSNGLGKGNCKTKRESFKFWDLVQLILELSQQFAMLVIILQPTLNFYFYNHPIWPPSVASGDLGNRKWNRIVVSIAT